MLLCYSIIILFIYVIILMYIFKDKNPSDEAAKLFREISESYTMLSDSKSRALVDQFGYEGAKERLEDSEGNASKLFPQRFIYQQICCLY